MPDFREPDQESALDEGRDPPIPRDNGRYISCIVRANGYD